MGYLNHLEVRGMEAVKAEVEEGFTEVDQAELDKLGI
jgi:hypothetical protein